LELDWGWIGMNGFKNIRAIIYEREKRFDPGLYNILGVSLWECAIIALGPLSAEGACRVDPEIAVAADAPKFFEALRFFAEDDILLLPDDKCLISRETLWDICAAYAQNGVYAAAPDAGVCAFDRSKAGDLIGAYSDIGGFTDALADELGAAGRPVPYAFAEDELTINAPPALATAARRMRLSVNEYHMNRGVMIIDPERCYISPGVSIGRNSVVYPGTFLEGRSSVGEGCVIGPDCRITDTKIGDGARIMYSVLADSSVGGNTAVGPFAYMRPGSSVGQGCKVGDFVEIKNSVIGDNTKISHLTYVGDSDVGSGVNFGCGTVTVNYDGVKKYRTAIGDNAFIGCNTNLIAPVAVGAGAYTAAGSTITHDVPPGALGIARERQTNKDGWVEKSGHKKY